MALFPAYSGGIDVTKDSKKEEIQQNSNQPKSWLANESFVPVQPTTIVDKEISSGDVEIVYEKSSDVQIIGEKIKQPKKVKKRRRRSKSTEKEKIEVKKTKHEKIDSIFIKPDPFAAGTSKNNLYLYDLKRDIENLQFGSVYKKQQALFKSKIKICLGASEKINQLIFPEAAGKKQKSSDRYFGRKFRKFAADPLQILPRKFGEKQKNLDEYIPVESEIKINDEKFVYDPSIQMYRPVVSTEFTSFFENSNDDDRRETIFLDDLEIVRENKRFNKLLTENPNDVRLWRQFLNFQDVFYEAKARKDDLKLTKLALLERKLAILDKALEKNANSYELKLLRMDVGLEAGWDRDKLKAEWKRLEFTHVNQPAVWTGRLKFAASHFSYFTVNRQSTLFEHCFEKLSNVLRNQLVTHPCLPGTETFFVDCLAAKMNLWKSSGHTEKFVALCQALLEFNFRQPKVVREIVRLTEKRKFFEPFWDSNCPRFGDSGAEGWQKIMENKNMSNFFPIEKNDESDVEKLNKIEDEICSDVTKNVARVWLEIETNRQTFHWKPYRNAADEPEDPERMVLLDDIENSLYEIFGPHNRFLLILKSLQSFGVKFPSFLSSRNEISWFDDDDCGLEFFDNLPKLKSFTTSKNFNRFDEFLTNLFDQLDSCLEDKIEKTYLTYIRIYDVAFTLTNDEFLSSKEKLKRFTKFVKEMLSKNTSNRNDVVLYGAYAEGLSKLGALNEALNVLQTALIGSNVGNIFTNLSVNSFDQLTHLYLFNLFVELRQKNAKIDQDLKELSKILATFIVNGRFTKIDENINFVIAKKQFFDVITQLETNYSLNDNSFFVASWFGDALTLTANLLSVFLYCLTTNVELGVEKISECRNVLKNAQKNISELTDNVFLALDKNLERSYENEIRLILFHSRLFWCPPKRKKRAVLDALQNYPSNGSFLKIYCDLHLHGQLIVELRRFFSKPLTKRTIWWTATVYAEFSRYLLVKEQNDEFCETHKMRHVFENALETCRNSCTLWRLFIKMELLWGETERAKKLLYQAVRQCPGSKDLCMDAIGSFPDDFQTFVDLMIEKELRVRLPVEELHLLLKAARQQNHDEESDEKIDNAESAV